MAGTGGVSSDRVLVTGYNSQIAVYNLSSGKPASPPAKLYCIRLKGQCHEIFLSGFFMNHLLDTVFASQGTPQVSTTLAGVNYNISISLPPLLSSGCLSFFLSSCASLVEELGEEPNHVTARKPGPMEEDGATIQPKSF